MINNVKTYGQFLNEAETYFDYAQKKEGSRTFVDMMKRKRSTIFKTYANVKQEADILEPVMKYLKVTKLEDMELVAESTKGIDWDTAGTPMLPGDRSWMKKFKTKELIKIKKMQVYPGRASSEVALGTLYGKPSVMFISSSQGRMDFEAFSKK
tara:strand:+ start:69 stop:527 length:459 start_codon:yes stop_codon:yes gene_type:complete